MDISSPAKTYTDPQLSHAPALGRGVRAWSFPPAGGAVRRNAAVADRKRWDVILSVSIVVAFILLTFEVYHFAAFGPFVQAAKTHPWARYVVGPAMLWTVMGTLLLAFRTVLWLRYRPFAAADFESAPSLTVIIPAYNEGAMVLKSIESAAHANYPRDRIEILAIDDGSSDDTWTYIQSAAARFPDIVTPVRFPKNRGKRDALAEGFDRARGEVVVTIDSDSVIEPDALLEISGPFRDGQIGAVAGKVAVYNRRRGLIPRMLHVRYLLSFDFLRAVESSYRTVYCCPGALTAYRTSAIRRVLGRWSTETFWGVPCTYGEDRALTNHILGAGYHTVYQSSAVVHTVAPESYGKLCKMFLRWDRSYIREEVRFQSIVWKRPWGARCIALIERFITNLRFPVHYASLALLAVLGVADPQIFLGLLAAIAVMSTFNMLYYLRSERSLDFVYGVLYAYFACFALFWIFPYALVTVRTRAWMTR